MHKYIKTLFIVVTVVLIHGCANIPLGTMLEFRSFDQNSFAQLEPQHIQAKIEVDAPVRINIDDVELSLAIDNEQGIRVFKYPLELINERTIPAVEGFFRDTPAKHEYTLQLSESAMTRFAETQAIVQNERGSDYDFSVRSGLADLPDDIDEVRLSIFLQLNEQRGFITLFEDVALTIEREE